MNTSRRHLPQRRLAIEHVENRLMLSGDGYQNLDTDTFNLDPIANDYAVISNDAVLQDVHVVSADSLGVSANFVELIKSRNNVDAIAIIRSLGNWTPLELQADLSGAVAGWHYQIYSDAAANGPASELDVSGNTLHFVTFGAMGTTLSGASADFGKSINLSIGEPSSAGAVTLPIEESLDSTIVAGAADILTNVRDVINVRDVVAAIEPLRSGSAMPALVIAPGAPANSIVTIGDSDAQVNVGAVIDELLTSGGGFVDQALPGDISFADSDDTSYNGSIDSPQTDSLFGLPEGEDTAVVVSAGEVADEGGMIPVQGIIGRLADEKSITASAREQVAVDHGPAEISGELARVAVMELIEGEADPAAPQQADYTLVVAAGETTITTERISLDSHGRNSAALATVRAVADQAGLAASLVAPANPVYLAAMISAANDAFAAAAMSAPLAKEAATSYLSRDDARSEAFSTWDDAPERIAADEETGRSAYGYLPLIGALAVERVIAARKRKQNAAAAPPLPVR